MSARPDTYTLKVTVARLLELSYARNEGLTARICVRSVQHQSPSQVTAQQH